MAVVVAEVVALGAVVLGPAAVEAVGEVVGVVVGDAVSTYTRNLISCDEY